jgi:phosphoglycolate phosphatase
MGRVYDLIVFDWEGTLGDPLGYILQVIEAQSKVFGFQSVNEQVARKYVMLGLEKALKKIFPTLTLHQYERLHNGVQQAMHAQSKEQCLFSGAKVLVECIHQAGIHLAIATNKGPQALQRALHTTELDAFFIVTRSAGQVPAKPCPQMLEEIMDVFGVSSEKTLMIGDSVADVEMATSIGVECIGVDFYHQQIEALEKAGASHVFDDYHQVCRYLELPDYLIG